MASSSSIHCTDGEEATISLDHDYAYGMCNSVLQRHMVCVMRGPASCVGVWHAEVVRCITEVVLPQTELVLDQDEEAELSAKVQWPIQGICTVVLSLASSVHLQVLNLRTVLFRPLWTHQCSTEE